MSDVTPLSEAEERNERVQIYAAWWRIGPETVRRLFATIDALRAELAAERSRLTMSEHKWEYKRTPIDVPPDFPEGQLMLSGNYTSEWELMGVATINNCPCFYWKRATLSVPAPAMPSPERIASKRV